MLGHINDRGKFIADPCALCDAESVFNTCPGDGRGHYHGRVHRRNGGLLPVCGACIATIKAEWANKHGAAIAKAMD